MNSSACFRAIVLAASFAAILLTSFPLSEIARAGQDRPAAESDEAEIVAQRLSNGIVVDVSPPGGGSPAKMSYDPAFYDAVKAAGFRSVRVYVVGQRSPADYQSMIQGALDRGLAVVISFWGSGRWASKPKEGIQEFVEAWDKYAKFYKDYSEDLVFDLWNEPAGLFVQNGKPVGINDGATVMEYLNAVIPVIRRTNPHRTLGIGGPGLNGCRELDRFVTPKYLTYRLEDRTGFAEDDNIIGLFHMYHPYRFTHWTLPLNRVPGWKEEVRELLSYPATWSEKWGKPALLSEWGAWAPPCHSVEDFKAYLSFVVEECKRHNIGWVYYTAGFNNQWAFNILNTEDGWNQDALDVLTGVTAPPPPPLSPVVNAEFAWSTTNWMSEGSAKVSVARGADLSGSSALQVEATYSDDAEVYQETRKGAASPPGRHLISMRTGRLYKISFLAKSAGGPGTVRIRLADVSRSHAAFWTSKPVEIASAKREYTIEYRHEEEDVNDVRLSFLFGDRDQTILLDRIALRGYRDQPEPRRKATFRSMVR